MGNFHLYSWSWMFSYSAYTTKVYAALALVTSWVRQQLPGLLQKKLNVCNELWTCILISTSVHRYVNKKNLSAYTHIFVWFPGKYLPPSEEESKCSLYSSLHARSISSLQTEQGFKNPNAENMISQWHTQGWTSHLVCPGLRSCPSG